MENPNSTPDQKAAATEKYEELNKEKKGLNKEIRREIISGGLALASGVCGFIPGAGAVVGAGLSLTKLALEKVWEHDKKE